VTINDDWASLEVTVQRQRVGFYRDGHSADVGRRDATNPAARELVEHRVYQQAFSLTDQGDPAVVRREDRVSREPTCFVSEPNLELVWLHGDDVSEANAVVVCTRSPLEGRAHWLTIGAELDIGTPPRTGLWNQS